MGGRGSGSHSWIRRSALAAFLPDKKTWQCVVLERILRLMCVITHLNLSISQYTFQQFLKTGKIKSKCEVISQPSVM